MDDYELLRSVSRYPIPLAVIEEISDRRGMNHELGRADVLVWLSRQPNISQGGQSYSFTEEERRAMRSEARAIYLRYGDERLALINEGQYYGYKGQWL